MQGQFGIYFTLKRALSICSLINLSRKCFQNVSFYDIENINDITKFHKLINKPEKKMHSKVRKSADNTKLVTQGN